MEFLAMLYTVLLVAICLMMALLLFRSGRPTGGLDEADCEELKDWLRLCRRRSRMRCWLSCP